MNMYKIFGDGLTVIAIVEAEEADKAFKKARAVFGHAANGFQRYDDRLDGPLSQNTKCAAAKYLK